MCQIFTYGLIACDLIGVVDGGVGIHVEELVPLYGPEPLTIFLKAKAIHLVNLC